MCLPAGAPYSARSLAPIAGSDAPDGWWRLVAEPGLEVEGRTLAAAAKDDESEQEAALDPIAKEEAAAGGAATCAEVVVVVLVPHRSLVRPP